MTSIRFKMIYIFKKSSDLKLIAGKNINAKYQPKITSSKLPTQNISAKSRNDKIAEDALKPPTPILL